VVVSAEVVVNGADVVVVVAVLAVVLIVLEVVVVVVVVVAALVVGSVVMGGGSASAAATSPIPKSSMVPRVAISLSRAMGQDYRSSSGAVDASEAGDARNRLYPRPGPPPARSRRGGSWPPTSGRDAVGQDRSLATATVGSRNSTGEEEPRWIQARVKRSRLGR
jgi:hypothetical protein